MNIVILEDSNYCIEPFISQFSKFPNSSKITINSSNYFESVQLLKTPPVLTKDWLVLVSPRLSVNQMKSVFGLGNLNIVAVSTKGKFEEIVQEFKDEGIKFRTYNNLQPPKDKVLDYVMKELQISYELACYICNRHKFYLPKVMESVAILETLEEINKKSIQSYTVRYNSVWLTSITDKLLGIEKTKNKKIVECIYRYRYGFDFLLKSIKKDLDIYEYAFSEISMGYLSLENYRDFESEYKGFKNLSNFRKLKIVESFEHLSYSKLYFIKLKVEAIESNPNCIYRLIELLGGD